MLPDPCSQSGCFTNSERLGIAIAEQKSGDGEKTKDGLGRAVLQGHHYPFWMAAGSRELQHDVELAKLVSWLVHSLQVVQVVLS